MIKTAWTSIAFLDGSQCLNYVVHSFLSCSWPFVSSWSFSNHLDLGFSFTNDLVFAASTELRAVLSSGSKRLNNRLHLIVLWLKRKGFTHSHGSLRMVTLLRGLTLQTLRQITSCTPLTHFIIELLCLQFNFVMDFALEIGIFDLFLSLFFVTVIYLLGYATSA